MGTNSAEWLKYLVLPSVIQFQKFEGLKFFVIHCTSMGSNWFTSTFSIFRNFLKLKRGDLICWGQPILQNTWLFGPALLYFNSWNLTESNSSSFFALEWFAMDSPLLFSIFWNFVKLKRADLVSWWEPILQNVWIIWSPLFYFNSRNFRDSNSLSFIALQWVPICSPLLFSIFWNFLKLKSGDLFSWWEPILHRGQLFGPPSFILILEIWSIQIPSHSLDFSRFDMIHQYFSQFFHISSN